MTPTEFARQFVGACERVARALARHARTMLYFLIVDWVAARTAGPAKNQFGRVHLKLDNMGDFILWSRASPRSLLQPSDMLVTSEINRPLVKMLGITNPVVFVDHHKLVKSLGYRFRTIRRLSQVSSERVINYQFSRALELGDAVVRCIRSSYKLGLQGDDTNQSWFERPFSKSSYSDLIVAPQGAVHELDKIRFFVSLLQDELEGPFFSEALLLSQESSLDDQLFHRSFGIVSVDASSHKKAFPYMDKVAEGLKQSKSLRRSIDTIVLVGLSHIGDYRQSALLGGDIEILDYVGKTQFEDLVNLVREAKFIVASDSLVGHLGELFSVPTVVVRSGILWDRFFPYPESSRLVTIPLQKSCPCRAICRFEGRNQSKPCFDDVSVHSVVSWVGTALASA